MRQQQVLRLIGEERTTKETAVEIGIARHTVEYHRMSLMRRTGIYNQIGLAKLAIRLGLVPNPAAAGSWRPTQIQPNKT